MAGAILIFTIMISTYLFVKYFSTNEKEGITENKQLLTEPNIGAEYFQDAFMDASLAEEINNQLDTYKDEEKAIPSEEEEFQAELEKDTSNLGEQNIDVKFTIEEKESAAASEESDSLKLEQASQIEREEEDDVSVLEEVVEEEVVPELEEATEEEVVSEPEEEVEEEVVTETVTKAKPLNRDLLDTLVQQLLWYKGQLSTEQYEQLLVDHTKEQLHDNDYYLFASMLRDHYIKTEQFDKLKSLLTKLKQRYNHKIVILEEITFFEKKFF